MDKIAQIREDILFDDISIVHGFDKLQRAAYDTAKEKGWYDPPKTFGEQLLLIIGEISEASEEYRNGKLYNEIYFEKDKNGVGKPCGIPIELADAVIRMMDMCQDRNIDLFDAIIMKMLYNLERPIRHGNKVI